MQQITPFLWFDNNAEEAVSFYTSIFKDSEIISTTRGGDNIMGITFTINNQTLTAFNGGPMFHFNEAISLFVSCETQAEIDYYWNNLTADGGKESRCGWLEDKFGLSWQIVPPVLMQFMSDENRNKANAVLQAMLKMNKLDITKLQAAYEAA